ncbi:MAG: hypothetical protein PVJ19_04530, partial [Desulfobacteraceae bacterium]
LQMIVCLCHKNLTLFAIPRTNSIITISNESQSSRSLSKKSVVPPHITDTAYEDFFIKLQGGIA